MIMLHNNNNKNFLKFHSKLLFLTDASIGYVGFSFSRLNLTPRVGFGSVLILPKDILLFMAEK